MPTTCAAAGAECGALADGCGGQLMCGDCTAPQTCGGGGMANRCGEGACTPTTCAAEGADCGMLSDGCAGVLDCGSCVAPATCGGGGTANRCGAPTMADVRLRFGMLRGVDLEVVMENDVAVAGFQFDLTGITVSAVEGGRANSGGFTASAAGARVLGFSATGATIAPWGSRAFGDALVVRFLVVVCEIFFFGARFRGPLLTMWGALGIHLGVILGAFWRPKSDDFQTRVWSRFFRL